MQKTLKSSSFNWLNGDFPLSKINKIFWLVNNIIHNVLPYKTDNNLAIKNLPFNYSDISLNIKEREIKGSPARALSDLFWINFPWKLLSDDLAEKLSIIEIGCGTGKYGYLLSKIIGNKMVSYTGIDIFENRNWSLLRKDKRFSFYVSNAIDIEEYLHGKNVIITQSAIEHFKYDLTFFEKIQNYVKNSKKTIYNIHLMPASLCIFTYLWHGYRTYNYNSVSKISLMFNDDKKLLIPLGGHNSKKLHQDYITKPWLLGKEDKRNSESEKYINKLITAINLDSKNKNANKCSFLALIIGSNTKKNRLYNFFE